MPVIVQQRNTTVVMLNRQTMAKIAAPGPQGARGQDGQQGPAGTDGAGQVPARMFSWGDAPQVVFTAPGAGRLALVRIQYLQAFNGAGATVVVGTPGDPAAAMPAEWNNPHSVLEYENSPDLLLAEGDTVVLAITPGTASQGEGLLFLTFIPSA